VATPYKGYGGYGGGYGGYQGYGTSPQSRPAPRTSVIAPLIPEAKSRVDKERRKIGPLQLILDLLSRGQYASANFVNAFIEGGKGGQPAGQVLKNAALGIGKGLLGREKGTYKDILKENLGPGWSKPLREGKRFLGKTAPGDVAGFILDVLMDPLTYLSFGSTKAAQIGAKAFADDIVRLTAKQLGTKIGGKGAKRVVTEIVDKSGRALTSISDDMLKRLAKEGFDIQHFRNLFKKSTKKALNYFTKHGGDVARLQNSLYKQAQRYALRTPTEELQRELLKRAGMTTDEIAEETVESLAKKMGFEDIAIDTPKVARSEKVPKYSYWHKLGPHRPPIRQPNTFPEEPFFASEFFQTGQDVAKHALKGYGETGERAVKFMGQELFKGIRNPPHIRAWDTMRRMLEKSKPGRMFSDAWWAIMNKGVVGDLRQKMGFKNPYQKALREIELNEGKHLAEHFMKDLGIQWRSISFDLDDNMKHALRNLFEKAEDYAKFRGPKGLDVYDLLERIKDPKINPQVYAESLGIKLEDFDRFKKAVEDVDVFLKKLKRTEDMWEKLGYGSGGDIINYLPTYWRTTTRSKKGMVMGGVKPDFLRSRNFTRLETKAQEIAKIKWIYGVTEEEANELIEKFGASAFSLDLDEIILGRLQAHSKFASKVNMLQKFKEFGIPVKELQERVDDVFIDPQERNLIKGLRRPGAHVDRLGLQQIDHPALEGLLFDNDVARILTRATNIVDDQIGEFNKAFTNYMKWWKGIVTMTPGFHARNFISNNVTGFLKFGPRWFRMKKYGIDSLVATVYSLNRKNPKKMLLDMGFKNAQLERVLTHSYGGYNLKELSEYMLRQNVVSEATMGIDAPATMRKMLGTERRTINPFPTGVATRAAREDPAEFYGITLSHGLGNIVENQARVQSFLMDLEDITGKSVADKGKLMRNYFEEMGDFKAGRFDYLTEAGKSDQLALEYAAREAKKWFLDYTDLTEFERNVLKKVIPFYTWLRKNIANQIQGITLNPGMYSLLPKLEDLAEMEDPEYDRTLIPDYMRQLGYFPTSKTDTGIISLMNPNIPIQDIARIPLMWQETEEGEGFGKIFPYTPVFDWTEVKDDLLSATNPVIKSAIELIPEKGYDVWRKKDLEGNARAPYALRFFTERPEALGLMDNVIKFMGGRGIQPEMDEYGNLTINARLAKLIENNLPIVRQLDMLVKTGEGIKAIGPALDDAIEGGSTAEEDYDKLDRFFDLLSYYAGIKFTQVDLEREKERYGRDIYKMAQGMRREYTRTSPIYRQKRLKRREKQDARIRRFLQ